MEAWLVRMRLGSLKAFISALAGEPDGRDRSEKHACQVAIAALLIRSGSIDGAISRARRDKLRAVLKSYFNLDDPGIDRLVEEATGAAADAVDLYHFTRRITHVLDEDGRRRIVEMMWDVIYADHRGVSPLESNMVWRVADLLGVPSRQRIESRRLASERASPTWVCGLSER